MAVPMVATVVVVRPAMVAATVAVDWVAACGDGCGLGSCLGDCCLEEPWTLFGEHCGWSAGGWLQLGYTSKALPAFNSVRRRCATAASLVVR